MKFNAEMKIVRFGSEDVIATSGALEKTITLGNVGDGIPGNSTITFGEYNLSSDNNSLVILIAMGKYFEIPRPSESTDVKFYSGKSFTYLSVVHDGEPGIKFDGSYVYSGYIDGKYVFTKKQ